MMDSNSIKMIKARTKERAMADKLLLENLRSEVGTLKAEVKQIIPRSSTAVSPVAADGGNNQVELDPYLFQLVRVVDSYGKELLVDVVSLSTNTGELTAKHLSADGTPHSALGIMMKELVAGTLWELSPMIPKLGKKNPNPFSVQVYGDLAECGALYQLLQQPSSASTLIVRYGLLRSTTFSVASSFSCATELKRLRLP
jgi:hypothetical protein